MAVRFLRRVNSASPRLNTSNLQRPVIPRSISDPPFFLPATSGTSVWILTTTTTCLISSMQQTGARVRVSAHHPHRLDSGIAGVVSARRPRHACVHTDRAIMSATAHRLLRATSVNVNAHHPHRPFPGTAGVVSAQRPHHTCVHTDRTTVSATAHHPFSATSVNAFHRSPPSTVTQSVWSVATVSGWASAQSSSPARRHKVHPCCKWHL